MQAMAPPQPRRNNPDLAKAWSLLVAPKTVHSLLHAIDKGSNQSQNVKA